MLCARAQDWWLVMAGPKAPRKSIKWTRVCFAVMLGSAVLAGSIYGGNEAAENLFPLKTDTAMAIRHQLDATVSSDRGQVDRRLVGTWVPVLAVVGFAKPAGQRIRPADIVAIDTRLERLRRRYKAVLVKSENYSVGKPGLYVSLAPRGYSSRKQALAWCHKNKLRASTCSPMHLPHYLPAPAT
jgi:hypothetical protein